MYNWRYRYCCLYSSVWQCKLCLFLDAAYFVSKSEGRSKRTSRHWNWTGHSSFWFSLMVIIYWVQTYKKNARALIITLKDDDLEINAEKSTHGSVFVPWQQTVGQNYSVKITSKRCEGVAKVRFLKKTDTSKLREHVLPFGSECSVFPSATSKIK